MQFHGATPNPRRLWVFLVRALERCIDCQDLQLPGPIDNAKPSIAQQANVKAVLREAEDPNYWVSASKDGNRESHYRGEFQTHISAPANPLTPPPSLCDRW